MKEVTATKFSWPDYLEKLEKGKMFHFFAQCLRECFEFNLALELQNINFQLYAESKDDLILAHISAELCMLSTELGNFQQAKAYGHQAVEIQIKSLGPSHAC